MKYPGFAYACLVLSVLCASAAVSADKITDGFEYKSMKELQAKWTVRTSGFPKPPEVKLTTTTVKEGKKALLISMPAVGADGTPRLDLDIYPDMPMRLVKQVNFWVYIENPQDIVQTGIHIGDATWANHYAKFGLIANVKGWQRVLVSTESLAAGAGKPTMDTVNQMRITFWFARGTKPAKIAFDDVIWSTKQERDQRLNKKWYE